MDIEHRKALAQYTIANLEEIKDQLGYVPHKLTYAGINVEDLRPDLGKLVNWVGGNIAEAREILDDIIEELKLEENQ